MHVMLDLDPLAAGCTETALAAGYTETASSRGLTNAGRLGLQATLTPKQQHPGTYTLHARHHARVITHGPRSVRLKGLARGRLGAGSGEAVTLEASTGQSVACGRQALHEHTAMLRVMCMQTRRAHKHRGR